MLLPAEHKICLSELTNSMEELGMAFELSNSLLLKTGLMVYFENSVRLMFDALRVVRCENNVLFR
jgi:hypothetical protein